MSIDWVFGQYKILKKIASGGMAEVFLAKRVGVEGFEKLLAIKKILPQFSENEEFISMFIDEAKLAAQLTHRNIVQIYDFGNQQGSYYLAMEYIFGKDLRSILKKSKEEQKRLPMAQCAYIITGAAKGLEYAHALKDHLGNPLQIIHRDISPQNILISYEGEVMVADFGIAKAASKSTETRAGILKGKILYMSPEQAWGKPIDKRSDIYSLGVVFYEMVADQKIFDADSELSMLEKVRNSEVEYPPEIFEKVPKRLLDIIKKALGKIPENRYQSAHEMRVDLENYLLSVRETLSEKMISEYLKDLFRKDIEEEKKVLTERIEVLVDQAISPEPLPETQVQEPEKIPTVERGLEEIEGIERKGFFISLKESFRKRDVRMRVGLMLLLCVLGGFIFLYLLTHKSTMTTSTVTEKTRRSTSSLPHSPSETPVGKSREEPSPLSKEPKPEKGEGTSFSFLVGQGPKLLRENNYMMLLKEIHKLSAKERDNINIKILESFAHLKIWVFLKDRNSKIHWENLYSSIEASGDRSATLLLLRIAKDSEEWTRLYAVGLLGSIGDRRALNDLQQISISDPNRRIRRNANKAISSIQSRG